MSGREELLLFEKYLYWAVSYTYPVTAAYGEYSGQSGVYYLELSQNGETVQGRTIEENFAKNSSQKILGGEIIGSLRGEELEFQKTYLPDTGLKHAIFYKAKVDFIEGRIIGSWFIPQTNISNLLVGSFEMRLDEGEFLSSNI